MTRKTTRTRAEAKKLMWEYYKEHKASLPRGIKKHRDHVLKLLIRGSSTHDAYEEVRKSAKSDTYTLPAV